MLQTRHDPAAGIHPADPYRIRETLDCMADKCQCAQLAGSHAGLTLRPELTFEDVSQMPDAVLRLVGNEGTQNRPETPCGFLEMLSHELTSSSMQQEKGAREPARDIWRSEDRKGGATFRGILTYAV